MGKRCRERVCRRHIIHTRRNALRLLRPTWLHAALTRHSALEWEEIFGDEVPCAAALKVEDMFDHLQVLAEDMVGDIEHPVIGHYRGITRPIKFGRTPGPDPFAAPIFQEVGAAEDGALSPQEVRKA